MMDPRGKMTTKEMSEVLFQKAVAMYGKERALELKPSLEQTAENLVQLTKYVPNQDLEPGFYLY